MSRKTNLGLLAAGGLVLLLPLSVGCGEVPGKGAETFLYNQEMNGRTAFLKTDGGFAGGNAETGTAASDLETGGTASMAVDGSPIADIAAKANGVTTGAFNSFGPTDLYGNGGGKRLEVTKIGNVDGDKTSDDTFLMFSHNAKGTEFGISYGGTRTTTSELEAVRKAKGDGHTATYAGVGEFYTTIGTNVLHHNGDLEVVATFGGAKDGITGEINNLALVGPPPPPGTPDFDSLKFDGKFDDTVSPDYQTTNFTHMKGKAAVTKMTSEGVGSLFGPKAGGTLGVFTGKGKIIHGGSDVNLIGAYHGRTKDNN